MVWLRPWTDHTSQETLMYNVTFKKLVNTNPKCYLEFSPLRFHLWTQLPSLICTNQHLDQISCQKSGPLVKNKCLIKDYVSWRLYSMYVTPYYLPQNTASNRIPSLKAEPDGRVGRAS